jgi:hypothetical protein
MRPPPRRRVQSHLLRLLIKCDVPMVRKLGSPCFQPTGLAFYRAAGFQLLYTRHDYYQEPVEDALVMACDITPSSEFPSRQK